MTRAAEPELYKDKIEVSLDGRQIFYLFFGGAVVACLVFVLGVMVGRRLEARAHVDRAAVTSTKKDPLAALDRLAEGKGELTYPAALRSASAPVADVDRALGAVIEPAPPVVAKPADRAVDKAADKTADKAAADKAADKAAADKAAADKAAADKAAREKADKAAADKAKAAAAEPDRGADTDRGADRGARARFTLQLSAFQDQGEAEAFLATVKKAGYAAYVVSAEVEGKGTFYRVRLGNYVTYDEAVAAKAEFERKVPKIAYVTRL
ncbi:MAG: SPOR domain-containing protein [Myxococcales bacterium]|nr:SPOR domain-containing protein [Myxococcales bacterium]